MCLTEAKRELMKKKIQSKYKPYLVPTDIIPIVNHAWNNSFANVDSNRRAICERDCLHHEQIISTMTKDDK